MYNSGHYPQQQVYNLPPPGLGAAPSPPEQSVYPGAQQLGGLEAAFGMYPPTAPAPATPGLNQLYEAAAVLRAAAVAGPTGAGAPTYQMNPYAGSYAAAAQYASTTGQQQQQQQHFDLAQLQQAQQAAAAAAYHQQQHYHGMITAQQGLVYGVHQQEFTGATSVGAARAGPLGSVVSAPLPAANGGEMPRRERFFVRRNGGSASEEVITSQKFLATFRVGIAHKHPYGVAKRIIGPGGRNMKLIASLIMGGKVRLRGEGFQDKDQQHPLQLNISCPTREGYILAKALVSKLLKQVLQDYHEYTKGQETAQMRGNDHPMNPEIPEGWNREFMRGYYTNMLDQVAFVTTLPKSGTVSSVNSSKKSTTNASSKIGGAADDSAGDSSSKKSAESESSGAKDAPLDTTTMPKVDLESGKMIPTAEVSTSADEQQVAVPDAVVQ